MLKKLNILFSILVIIFSASLAFAQQTPAIDPEVLKIWQEERTNLLEDNKRALTQLIKNANQVVGIELVIAGPINDRVESKFGHAMLRFVGSSKDAISDYVISFVADVDEPILSYKKGIVGDYKVLPLTNSFGSFIQSYLEAEERPLARYIIPTTAQQRHAMLMKLHGWLTGKDKFPNYKFATDNCAGVILSFLRDAGVPTLFSAPIPSQLPLQLSYQYLSPYPPFVSTTSAKLITAIAKKLAVQEQVIRRGSWPKESIELFKQIPTAELTQLYYKAPPQDPEIAKEMRQIITKTGPVKLESVYGLISVAPITYQLCSTTECAQEIVKSLSNSNVKTDPKRLQDRVRGYVNRHNPFTSEILRKYVKHSLLISEALP